MGISADVVVKRAPGAAGIPPALAFALRLGVVGRTRGKSENAKADYHREDDNTLELDKLDSYAGIEEPLRAIDSIAIKSNGLTFYPGIHFQLRKWCAACDSDWKECDFISRADLLGEVDKKEDIIIDWSATSLLHPPTPQAKIGTANPTKGFDPGTELHYKIAVASMGGGITVDPNSLAEPHGRSLPSGHTVITIAGVGPKYPVKVLWKRVIGARKYLIYRKNVTDGDNEFKLIGLVNEDTLEFEDTENTSLGTPNVSDITVSGAYPNKEYSTPAKQATVTSATVAGPNTDIVVAKIALESVGYTLGSIALIVADNVTTDVGATTIVSYTDDNGTLTITVVGDHSLATWIKLEETGTIFTIDQIDIEQASYRKKYLKLDPRDLISCWTDPDETGGISIIYSDWGGVYFNALTIKIAGNQEAQDAIRFSESPLVLGTDTPDARMRPGVEETCDFNSIKAVLEYNQPKEFTSWEKVEEEYGVGSELANLARLYMDINGCPIITCVPTKGESFSDILDALVASEKANTNFLSIPFANTDDDITLWGQFQTIDAHCNELSDEKTGQKERKFTCGMLNGATFEDARAMAKRFQNTGKHGVRSYLVWSEGGTCKLNMWRQIDGSYEYNVTLKEIIDSSSKVVDVRTADLTEDEITAGYTSVDITPMALAGSMAARFYGLGDYAMPMTEKDVIGFSYEGEHLTLLELVETRNEGVMVIENRDGVGVVSRSISVALPVTTLEDAELNIAQPEDYMKIDMRRRAKSLRGNKMPGPVFAAGKKIIIVTLRQWQRDGLIAAGDEGSIKVYQDPIFKDEIRGFYRYMPFYPVNKVWIEYDFFFRKV